MLHEINIYINKNLLFKFYTPFYTYKEKILQIFKLEISFSKI